jgi:hypothetical protein
MAEFDPARLLPVPQQLKLLPGAWSPAALAAHRLDGPHEDLDALALVTDALGRALGRELPRAAEDGPAVVTLAPAEPPTHELGDEHYSLTAGPGGVRISGASPRALFWGVQTLRQLAELAGPGPLTALHIRDWPAFAFRSYSDDISRRQVSTLQDFEFIIENLARLKYNVYQPYMEDLLFLDRHPLAGLGRGRLTRDEVASLVEFGRRRFIDIMPQFNSLSHQEHLLARPEYAAWRRRGNLENLDPENPEVLDYLRDACAQIFQQFPAPFFHMGLDECRGLVDRPDLFVRHVNFLADMILQAGKTPVMWHDMFHGFRHGHEGYTPELLDQVNPRIVMDLWVYSADRPERTAFIQEAASRGFRLLLSPRLHQWACGAGTPGRWEDTAWLLRLGVDNPAVLGVNNTSWNDSGENDRHLLWRDHALGAQMSWHGPGPVEEQPRVAAAFARHFYGLSAPEDAAALEQAARLGERFHPFVARATHTPRALAQSVTRQEARQARELLAAARELRPRLKDARKRAPRNPAHLDHVLFGLDRLEAGARRVRAASSVRKALKTGDTERLETLMARETRLLHKLRAGFAEIWLRRHKPEGLEYADLRFRYAISRAQTLPWRVRHNARRADRLIRAGFRPLDLARSATAGPDAMAPLPWGLSVLDNVPWRVAEPTGRRPRSLVWLRSDRFPDFPEQVSIPAGAPARRVHFLHGVYGRDHADTPPGTYRLRFAGGETQDIPLRGARDVGDWWMPFGHPFGGGGSLRVDPDRCRLAFLTGPDEFQGHCLWHFWADVDCPDRPIESVEVRAGSPAVSLILAALTLEGDGP